MHRFKLAGRWLSAVWALAAAALSPLEAQQATMMNMQRLACHYSTSEGRLTLAMMSMSERTHPTRSFSFRNELDVLLETGDERRTLIHNGDLIVVVIGDMVLEDHGKHKLFRFNLVMDESGSIDDRSLMDARGKISKFFNRIPVSYRAQIIRFSNVPEVLTPFTNDRRVLLGALNQPRATGGTAFYDAIDQALTELRQSGADVPLQFTVAFTDGQDTSSTRFGSFEDFKRKVHMVTQREQMPIFLAGIGEEVDHELLSALAGNMGFYMPLKELPDIDRLFEAVASAIEKTYIIRIPISSNYRDVRTIYLKRRTGSGNHETVQDIPLPPRCIPSNSIQRFGTQQQRSPS